jgi:hypothetical protein
MTTGELYEFSPEPVSSYSLRPLDPEAPVVAANHRRRNGGENGSSRFVTVCVHECSSKSVIDPHIPRLCVELEPFVAAALNASGSSRN